MSESRTPAEQQRLRDAAHNDIPWKKWGPYLSERQWGTVRENMTPDVEAWNDVTHDQSRSRAYHSGEDGIAGFCDDQHAALLRARALERQGSDHQGAPVRPDQQRGQPRRGRQGVLLLSRQHADALVREDALQVSAGGVPVRADWSPRTGAASRNDFEYELLDTGRVRRGPLLGRVRRVRQGGSRGHPASASPPSTAGPEPAIARTCCPSSGSATPGGPTPGAPRPAAGGRAPRPLPGRSPRATSSWAQRFLYCDGAGELLFTDNETNRYRLWGQPNPTPYQKDGINDYIVNGRQDAVNPDAQGDQGRRSTRRVTVAPGQSATVRLRLTARAPGELADPFGRLRRDVRGPQARGRRVLRAADPADRSARTPPASSARATPGCCGPSRPTSTTSSAG